MPKKKLTKTDMKVLKKVFGSGLLIIIKPKEEEGTLTIVTPMVRLRWPNPDKVNIIDTTKPAAT